MSISKLFLIRNESSKVINLFSTTNKQHNIHNICIYAINMLMIILILMIMIIIILIPY